MAVQANGKPKKGKPLSKDTNFDAQMNGHVGRLPKRDPPRRGAMVTIYSISARVIIWYLIITTAFRCPSSISQLSESSPKICKPYLNLRFRATPYLDPYYQDYLGPYVGKIQPYVDKLNEQIYSPAATFAQKSYSTYAAPQLATAQRRARDEWIRVVKPQVDAAQIKAKQQYDANLAQHVNKAFTATSPYYHTAKTATVDNYQNRVIPAYKFVLPYAQQGYQHGNKFVVNVLFPNLQNAQVSTLSFLKNTVWPHIRILYGANVEPQLMKISERLGRYKDTKKVEAVVKAQESFVSFSTELSEKPPATLSEDTSVTKNKKPTKPSNSKSATPAPSKDKNYDRAEVEKKIQEDIRSWQSKFATAADKGAEDLDERVSEITKRQIETQVDGVGASYLTQLEESAKSQIDGLKSTINGLVETTSLDSSDEELEEAYEKAVSAVRAAGLTVRDKAVRVRDWKKKFDTDTFYLVKAALDSTLKVLDKVSDLGLQELGMRWAWTEGVTYKDWKLYHKLRNTFDGWRREVQDLAIQHKGMAKARQAGEDMENKAMDVAAETAKELSRLKSVARWKIWAHDSSIDFSDRKVPARAAKAAQKVMNKASDAKHEVIGSSQGIVESVMSRASKSVEVVSSSISSAVTGPGSDESSNIASKASEALAGTKSGIVENAASSAEEASSSVVSAVKEKKEQLSEAVKGTPAPMHESIASEISSSAESAASSISDVVESPKKVLGGAMAQQIVEARDIIIDDDLDDNTASEKVQKVMVDAKDQAAEISRAISEALLKPTGTQGSIESITSLANEQYDRAMAAASSVLYGPEVGFGESIANEASVRYSQAVTAASYAIYGTPTPVLQSLSKEASSRYEEATKLASEQFDIAKARLSTVAGDNEPLHKEMLSSLEKAYTGALQAASSRLDAALQITKTIRNVVAPTQGPLESISSVASSRLAEGLSAASARYSKATAAMNLEPTPVHRQYFADAQRKYYEGIGIAHARYSEFIEAASNSVYGTPTPAYQTLLGAAQSQFSAATYAALENLQSLLDSASSAAGATSSSPAQSVIEAASSQYDAALSSASSVLNEASSRASVALYGTSQGKFDSAASVVSASAESAASAASGAISDAVIGTKPSLPESITSQASQNWEYLVSKASEQIYGAPTPFGESIASQAAEYGAQATDEVASQYAALQALISDLIIGKEPDFTESVMLRLSSAYNTGYPAMASSASSYISDTYASASSVVTTVFTPPATLEAILEAASEQLNAVVDAASVQIYGTEKGTVEKASSAAAEAYETAASRVSEAVYGSQTGYAEAAQSSLADVAASASSAISVAIYGQPTGTVEDAMSSAAGAYSSVSSMAGEKVGQAVSSISDTYEAVKSKASEAVYGPEQGAAESAASRVAAAVESARARLSAFSDQLGGQGTEAYESVSSKIEEMASQVGSAASSATERIKDEL